MSTVRSLIHSRWQQWLGWTQVPSPFQLCLQSCLSSLEYNSVSFLGQLSYVVWPLLIVQFPPLPMRQPHYLLSISLTLKACPHPGLLHCSSLHLDHCSPALGPAGSFSSFGLWVVCHLLRSLSWPPSLSPLLLLHCAVIFSLQLSSKIIFIYLYSVCLLHFSASSTKARTSSLVPQRILHPWNQCLIHMQEAEGILTIVMNAAKKFVYIYLMLP